MDRSEKNTRDYYVIDMAHIVKAVWHRIWVVVFVSILTAALGFAVAAFAITPTYSSSVMLYVNNGTNLEELGFSISSSELTAAQSLAKTYTVLLTNRTTLNKVLEHSGLEKHYDWEDINEMIESGPVNETEVLRVTVTCENPKHAYRLARSISIVFPEQVVPDIVKDATMAVVDAPFEDYDKVAPSVTAYTAVGFFLGAVLSVVVLIILALMDNTIHDDDYIIKTYEYPILAKIPSLTAPNSKRYGYSAYRYGSKGGDHHG
ncbi:MAG: hypothetical protein E7527_03510 [Ruminococcaceae bacterium]|nr:hypothetical protein [Oscillospiraceae bacterium]